MSVNHKLMSLTTAEIAILRPSLKYLGCGEWESPAGDIFDEEDIQHLDSELAGAYLNSLPALVEALKAACEFWYDDMPNPSDDAIELHDKVVKLLKELK
jgi:hypothetical protein